MTLLEARRQPLRALAEAAAGAAGGGDLRGALATLADATLEATQADLVVLRLRSADGDLPARAVAPATSALAAEVAGSRATLEELEAGEAPAPTRRAAEAIRASGVHVEAARVEGRIVGSVELVRVAAPFDDDDRAAAALVAAQIALATRALGDGAALPASRQARRLELAGEALAAGGDTRRAAQQAVRTAADTTGANAGAVWRLLPEGGLELPTRCGRATAPPRSASSSAARARCSRCWARRSRTSRSRTRSRLPSGASRSCCRSSSSACTCSRAGRFGPPPDAAWGPATKRSPAGCSG